jgi:hypothetical protein
MLPLKTSEINGLTFTYFEQYLTTLQRLFLDKSTFHTSKQILKSIVLQKHEMVFIKCCTVARNECTVEYPLVITRSKLEFLNF